MGLLTDGTQLSHEETKKLCQHVREHGIIQFIHLYNRFKDLKDYPLKWGDEVEYMIVKFDDEAKTARLSLRSHQILEELNKKEEEDPEGVDCLWRPEYAAYQIEGTPGKPYGGLLSDLKGVEENMRLRREEAEKALKNGEKLLTLTNYPRLGCPDFSHPIVTPTPGEGYTHSLFFPDKAIYLEHPRYKATTENARRYRGENPAVNVPIFMDLETKIPVDDSYKLSPDALPDHVYMDSHGFGMGCSCLQMTMQASDVAEAKVIYDQLAPIAPIMLALSAASPIYRGFITDVDCRWSVLSNANDCRSREERGLEPLESDKFVIPKSRYDSISTYLSPQGEKFNDIDLVHDREFYKQLVENGVDHLLARHIAHLFIRNTTSLLAEKVHQNDEEDNDHFENLQSTNWQTMRFKVPPLNAPIGWRVEFRPCEIQITDFENAAIACFVILLSRAILSYNLDFLMPISKVDENMKNAQKRDACKTETFWFRKTVTPETNNDTKEFPLTRMSLDEIFNGKVGEFPGLISLINKYLSGMDMDPETYSTIQKYLKFIEQRASGEILTTASWIRKYVTEHPEYKRDSKVSEKINYDLLKTVEAIQSGKLPCPELLGQPK